jgi:predicted Zn-dependent protease
MPAVSTSWIAFLLLSLLTGNPLLALLLVVAFAWATDRFTFRLLPSPGRALGRWRRLGALRRTLAVNPHDRRSRLELADLLLERSPREAAAVLRPNLEAGDDDVHTAWVYGAALARSGDWDEAERILAHARAADPEFRLGEVDLELGRMRLRRGDLQGARQALERLVGARPGTVEGRLLLARALDRLGDQAAAERARVDGWREYASLPGFQRRLQRRHAWRLRPWRAVLVLAALGAGVALALLLALAYRAGE